MFNYQDVGWKLKDFARAVSAWVFVCFTFAAFGVFLAIMLIFGRFSVLAILLFGIILGIGYFYAWLIGKTLYAVGEIYDKSASIERTAQDGFTTAIDRLEDISDKMELLLSKMPDSEEDSIPVMDNADTVSDEPTICVN